MASITTRSNGSRFITFRDANHVAHHITLGKAPKRYAEAVKVRVEDLASAAMHSHSPSADTARWLASLDDRMHAKLADVGLVQPRRSASIGDVLEQYFTRKGDELKAESVRKLRQTMVKLLAYFDPATPMNRITADDAAAWRRSLKDLGLSEAAIRTHSGNVKTMLADALRRKVIEENPFAAIKSGPTPSRYTRYVTPDEIDRVIEACPDSEWRLLFGLARYAGLRVPSESHRLTWSDVDFERGRLTVYSPKTERWAGHEQRLVPITPKLMALLRDRFETMPEGEERLVRLGGHGALLRPVRRIVARAGVELWARLWQTLRSSCEKQWAMTFPQYAVSKWIGHSITVSGRHYANAVPDELFDRAAQVEAGAQRDAQRNAQLKVPERGGNGKKEKVTEESVESRKSREQRELRDISEDPEDPEKWSRGESNPRPVQSNCRLYVCSRLFDLDPRTASGSLPLDHSAIVSHPLSSRWTLRASLLCVDPPRPQARETDRAA